MVIKLLMRFEEATALACVGFWLSGFRARLQETPVTRCDAPVVTAWPIPALDELLARVQRSTTAVNRSVPVRWEHQAQSPCKRPKRLRPPLAS